MALTNTVKNTHNSEKNVRPISISERSGLVFVFGKFSERINRKTISDNITVIANDILSPESHGTRKLIIINDDVTIFQIVYLNKKHYQYIQYIMIFIKVLYL